MTYRAEDVAAIVVPRARPEVRQRSLAALADQTVHGFFVSVAEDGSVDDAGRPLVLLVGEDVAAEREMVAAHLDAHVRRPAAEDAVAGPVRPGPEAAGSRLARWLEWSGTLSGPARPGVGDAERPTFSASNVSLKSELLRRAGGSGTFVGTTAGALDLGRRLEQEGMRLSLAPGAVVRQLGRNGWEPLRRRFEIEGRAERAGAAGRPTSEAGLRQRCAEARHGRAPLPVWPLVADRLPPGGLRDHARRETDRWYLRRLAPYLLNAWESERDMEELRAYLGDRFDEERLWHHSHDVEAEEAAAPDDATFYRTSEAYLYDLTAFASWDTKIPYREDIRRAVPPGSRLLDYGCGIGSDGLRLLEDGYRVDFADFANPSTRYLQWRLERRGVAAPVLDVEAEVPGGYDLAYSLDVIEHVDDPFAFLAELESRARLVAVNFLEPAPHDTHLHHQLPVPELLDHAERRGLLRYRVYHHRSHFVIYRSGRPEARPSGRSRLERLSGPVLSRRAPGRTVYFPGGMRRDPG